MYIASIFHSNIINYEPIIEFVLEFEKCKISLSESILNVVSFNGKEYSYKLEFFEKDLNTVSYLGEFENGEKFRLIKPVVANFQYLKEIHKFEDTFSVGSIDPQGYGIAFSLYDESLFVVDDYNLDEKIECLKIIFDNSIKLNSKINIPLKILKFLLNIIPNVQYLRTQKYNHLVKTMEININLFSKEEINKIILS